MPMKFPTVDNSFAAYVFFSIKNFSFNTETPYKDGEEAFFSSLPDTIMMPSMEMMARYCGAAVID